VRELRTGCEYPLSGFLPPIDDKSVFIISMHRPGNIPPFPFRTGCQLCDIPPMGITVRLFPGTTPMNNDFAEGIRSGVVVWTASALFRYTNMLNRLCSTRYACFFDECLLHKAQAVLPPAELLTYPSKVIYPSELTKLTYFSLILNIVKNIYIPIFIMALSALSALYIFFL
jgi:hypothetical protein